MFYMQWLSTLRLYLLTELSNLHRPIWLLRLISTDTIIDKAATVEESDDYG
jgi:hypothetical protein